MADIHCYIANLELHAPFLLVVNGDLHPVELLVSDLESNHSQHLHVMQTSITTRRHSDSLSLLELDAERKGIERGMEREIERQ